MADLNAESEYFSHIQRFLDENKRLIFHIKKMMEVMLQIVGEYDADVQFEMLKKIRVETDALLHELE